MVPVYSAMVEDLKADKFGTRNYTIGLADNSVALLKTKHIPDDVWAVAAGSAPADHRRQDQGREVHDAQAVRAMMSSVSAE